MSRVKVLGTAIQYSWFSVISGCPHKTVQNVLQFSLPLPYTKLKLGKNSGYTCPTCSLWGGGGVGHVWFKESPTNTNMLQDFCPWLYLIKAPLKGQTRTKRQGLVRITSICLIRFVFSLFNVDEPSDSDTDLTKINVSLLERNRNPHISSHLPLTPSSVFFSGIVGDIAKSNRTNRLDTAEVKCPWNYKKKFER